MSSSRLTKLDYIVRILLAHSMHEQNARASQSLDAASAAARTCDVAPLDCASGWLDPASAGVDCDGVF
jgi:hypothetical protein